MKVLVCGGRDYKDWDQMYSVMDGIDGDNKITWLIHGEARGADRMAGAWAVSKGIHISSFPANWAKYGKRAGYVRNKQMLDERHPDLVVAFPGGRGTAMMVQLAREQGVPVIEIN